MSVWILTGLVLLLIAYVIALYKYVKGAEKERDNVNASD